MRVSVCSKKPLVFDVICHTVLRPVEGNKLSAGLPPELKACDIRPNERRFEPLGMDLEGLAGRNRSVQ